MIPFIYLCIFVDSISKLIVLIKIVLLKSALVVFVYEDRQLIMFACNCFIASGFNVGMTMDDCFVLFACVFTK